MTPPNQIEGIKPSVIAALRDKLEQLIENIDLLCNYKALHDCLQTIHLRHYPIIAGKVKQFRTDPLASAELETTTLELKHICSDAYKAAESLPNEAAVRAGELQWVQALDSAIAELSKAIEDRDDRGAAHAAHAVKRVIRLESLRINARLTLVAETLPLEELKQTLEKVLVAEAIDSSSAVEVQNATRLLQNTQSRLRERAAEHKRWQEIDNHFWEAEECIERRTPDSIKAFSALWPGIKSQVEALAHLEQEADWAKTTRKQAALIDRDMTDRVDSAMTHFKHFREAALYHFYEVDKALRAQCAELLKIRAPLRSFLSKV